MNKIKVILFCCFCMLSYCRAYSHNHNIDTTELGILTYPQLKYRGISRQLKPISSCSYDSLLSVYIEDKLQYLAAFGYEGVYNIKMDISINKKGRVKDVYIYKTYKEWDKIYEIIPKIIKKIKFNPATNNQKATKSKIQVVVKIDTYQYPSDISKKLFPRLTP